MFDEWLIADVLVSAPVYLALFVSFATVIGRIGLPAETVGRLLLGLALLTIGEFILLLFSLTSSLDLGPLNNPVLGEVDGLYFCVLGGSGIFRAAGIFVLVMTLTDMQQKKSETFTIDGE
ncbi:hypothetical protein [Calycomorphotria hydatis]|uniref:NADH-quinone oxidoreductase subunit K n=1 Tax=Calycomorphotria hydatis TaxID=2528027 RepID=A0A517T7D8_9PLAN|nr:hypothetical protein [Calycomorphotria hydatis]QDT64288.1 hypothetical protein V22_15200 [Calycomorphotria hydatis]